MAAEQPQTTVGRVGYWRLLRRNAAYRRLWLGVVVSMAGDWFRTIALYRLVLALTGTSGLALGAVLSVEMLAIFVCSPLAGVVADRYSRKAVMVAADGVRAVLVLGFLGLTADRLWLAYGLAAALMGAAAFFQPAYLATIPLLTSREELLVANALGSASWAVMLAVGSALGGAVVAVLGTQAAFVIDAVSYLISALCIATVPIPAGGQAARIPGGWQALGQGLRYVAAQPRVRRLLTVKACGAGLGGGMLLLFVLFAEEVFHAGALGLGVLYMTRGLGAAVGPVLARRLAGERPAAMEQAIGWAFGLTGSLYVAFAHTPTLLAAALVLCLAYMAASVLWVFSTTLLQVWVPDAYRGRVFAADFALFTFTMAVSALLTGWAADTLALSPRTLATVLGILVLLPAGFWLWPRR
ncbi:MAG: MFS transporter [Candidatus Tectimicrobiota bacterium]|nr:MAG: MFS transporter [Candidatus Tectomicrobia bacterium]